MASSGFETTRYADLVIQCKNFSEAENALALVAQWTSSRGLKLHPTKIKIVDVDLEGFEFPGYHFIKRWRFPRTKSLMKFNDTIRRRTRRANCQSVDSIISDLNVTLRGWYEYFKHSWKSIFSRLDGYIRQWLRSSLRKRYCGEGRGRGLEHFRYPNAFFAEQGLMSLAETRTRACQSLTRKPQAYLSTGEPDAGDLSVQYGGRGVATQCSFPTLSFSAAAQHCSTTSNSSRFSLRISKASSRMSLSR